MDLLGNDRKTNQYIIYIFDKMATSKKIRFLWKYYHKFYSFDHFRTNISKKEAS